MIASLPHLDARPRPASKEELESPYEGVPHGGEILTPKDFEGAEEISEEEVYEELSLRHFEEVQAWERKEYEKALAEQLLAAKLYRYKRRWRTGKHKFQIHPFFYNYWGIRLGYECWRDNQFVEEFLRDNDMCRIISLPRTAMVGYTAAIKYAAQQAASHSFWKIPTKFDKRKIENKRLRKVYKSDP